VRKCRKFQGKFQGEPVPGRHSVFYLASKLKTEGSLLEKQPDRKQSVLTEETLDDIDARLETPLRKPPKSIMQEMDFSRISA
jgi:hypothetical protein